jgi:hypothetical protein
VGGSKWGGRQSMLFKQAADPPKNNLQAFYAACEERDKPALKDLPMAVGGMGMITTANYHVRGDVA